MQVTIPEYTNYPGPGYMLGRANEKKRESKAIENMQTMRIEIQQIASR